MSKHTSVKIAATVTALLVLPLAFQWHSNAKANDELAALRAVPPPPPALEQRLAAIEAGAAAKRDAAIAAEQRTRELADIKRRKESEVLVSLGTLDSMARKVVDVMHAMDGIIARQKQLVAGGKPDPSTDEGRALIAEMEGQGLQIALLLPKAITVLRDIPKLERTPEKAGRFYSSLVAGIEEFDEPLRAEIERRTTAWVRELQSESLAFPQRPKGKESEEWDRRRLKANTDFLDEITREVPRAKFKRFTSELMMPGMWDMLFGGSQ